MPDPERFAREVLEERARALARPLERRDEGEAVELLAVHVGDERYAIELSEVGEVLPFQAPASVPDATPGWVGVVNVRGALHPVLDLGTRLGVRAEVPSDRACLVVVARDGATAALIVDDLPEVLRVPVTAIGPPPPAAPAAIGEVVRGATPDLLSVIDVAAVLQVGPAAVADAGSPAMEVQP